MIQILKLTPPQIAALRDALPASVRAGVLVTTASVATFRQVQNTAAGIGPVPAVPWTRETVRGAVLEARARADARGDLARPLTAVLQKLTTRPDLVREVSA